MAFSFEVPLFLRVLRSAHTNAADSVEMRLCMRPLPQASLVNGGTGESQSVQKPFLAFSSQGHNMNMVQDMPVSKPLNASGVMPEEGILGHPCRQWSDLMLGCQRQCLPMHQQVPGTRCIA